MKSPHINILGIPKARIRIFMDSLNLIYLTWWHLCRKVFVEVFSFVYVFPLRPTTERRSFKTTTIIIQVLKRALKIGYKVSVQLQTFIALKCVLSQKAFPFPKSNHLIDRYLHWGSACHHASCCNQSSEWSSMSPEIKK